MNNVLPFRKPGAQQQEVREQAALWIARLDAGASPDDLQQIQHWLAQDPLHAETLLDLARLWDRMSVLGDLATMFPLESTGKQQHGSRVAYVLAAAASLVAVVGIALHALRSPDDVALPQQDFQAQYVTGVGEQRSIELLDGSRIVLNTDSRIAVDFSAGLRRIELYSGEGLFEVAKDAARPFQVHAGSRMVEAVGTAFSVHRGNGEALEVFVTEGRVLLHAANDSTAAAATPSLPLNAGQYASLASPDASAVAIDIATDQLEEQLSWQHGMLLFRDEPLADVLNEVARYTTLNITAEPALLDMRVGGYFRVDDVEALLSTIDTNLPIDIQRNDRRILLVPQ